MSAGIVASYPLGSFPQTGLPAVVVTQGGDYSLSQWHTKLERYVCTLVITPPHSSNVHANCPAGQTHSNCAYRSESPISMCGMSQVIGSQATVKIRVIALHSGKI